MYVQHILFLFLRQRGQSCFCIFSLPVCIAARTTAPPDDLYWYDGNCQDDHTEQTLVKNTINKLNSSYIGSMIIERWNKTPTREDFQIFCGSRVSIKVLNIS